MKTSSKLFFVLGVLATVGTMSVVYCATQDTDKSPKELLDDGKKFIKNSVKKGDRFIENTVENAEKETKSILKEAKEIM